MLQTLSDIQPLIIIGMLMVMYGAENVWPYLAKPANKKKHDIRNFILAFISFALNGVLSVGVVSVLTLVADHHYGLLNQLPLSTTTQVIMGVFLIDLGSYCGHILAHKVPFLWISHRVHHSDPNLDASSTLRFHPFDTIYSQGLVQCIWFFLMGISMSSFIIYGTLFLPLFICQHSNVQFPAWFEKYARYIISTPGWHKIHHAADQQYTDSHYGDFFTIWDRIFGTWHKVQPEEVTYGLHEFNEDKQHSVGYLLSVPFKKLKRS